MQSKSRNLNVDLRAEWMISLSLHGVFVAVALLIFFNHPRTAKKPIDIEVIEAPKVAPLAVQITKPHVEKAKAAEHQVFGVSRKAITESGGEAVKAGNTVAKAPDNEKLKPSDPDSLPVPSEEYLITKMPELRAEVRIPYPPSAKEKGIEGAVVMDLLIDATGRVREVKLVNGPDPALSEAAVAAVHGFQFTPALIQDKPVAVRIRYAYRFVLEHG